MERISLLNMWQEWLDGARQGGFGPCKKKIRLIIGPSPGCRSRPVDRVWVSKKTRPEPDLLPFLIFLKQGFLANIVTRNAAYKERCQLMRVTSVLNHVENLSLSSLICFFFPSSKLVDNKPILVTNAILQS